MTLRHARASGRGGPSVLDVAFYMPHIGPLLSTEAAGSTGGAETQIWLLARELSGRGHHVGLISSPGAGDLPSTVHGISIIALRKPTQGHGRLVRKVLQLVNLWQAFRQIRTPVVVQRAAGFDTGAVAVAARLKGAKFVYSSAHVLDFDYRRLNPLLRDRILFHLGIRLSSKIIVQTSEQVEMCRRRFRREPTLIRSIAEPAPRAEGVPRAFLWVGRPNPYKRPYEYIALARALPDARFWMVVATWHPGEGLNDEELVRAAQALPNLELLPPRPRDQLMALIDQAVAIVNTSEYEGLSNVFLEGWARGIPALALSHDPDGIIERERIGHFAAGSRDALAAYAGRLWEERGQRAALSERCRAYIRSSHAPPVIADRWTDALGLAPRGA